MGEAVNVSVLLAAIIGGAIATLVLALLFNALWRKVGASPMAAAWFAGAAAYGLAVTLYSATTGRTEWALVTYGPGALLWSIVLAVGARRDAASDDGDG